MKKVIAIVEKGKCHPDKCGLECMKYDPLNRIKQDSGFHIGKSGKSEIAEEVVTEMHRISAKKCPFQAIHIVNLPEELKEEPIHRYGINGFRIFRFPIPRFNSVVGLVGKNGIGKSTILQILAGITKPNLGKDSASYEEFIDYLKGTEAQAYFEKLKDKEIKVSFKPQKVDEIPKLFSGTVRSLLEKSNETKKLKEVIKELDLENILDRDIKDISGGELQRVAIAACVLKKANLYIIDEPTSYLDIKQRLKVAQFIKNLVNETTGVIVVEHDLLIMDYMADHIHIVYGQPALYGIISQPKSIRNGINAYLEGMLKEENIRFRDKPITFEIAALERITSKKTLVEWPEIKKSLNSFTLEANQGVIKEKEVIGVLGENGIGKTTFVRILAGEIPVENFKEKLKVAYKPQYITPTDDLVAVALKKCDKNQIKPLDLDSLMLKKLSQLSGGELQRVMIAKTLFEEADIYLIDEPSAYLDVEQRLIVSRLIKDNIFLKEKSAIIVDHDLIFLDHISSNLMVFTGQPAIHGIAEGPFKMEDGMNKFLKNMEITMRRDMETKRPRINKLNSQLDKQQKQSGHYFYT